MNRLIALCAAALLCAPALAYGEIDFMPGSPCVSVIPGTKAVHVTHPVQRAWELCQRPEFLAVRAEACAKITQLYAETGIAAREQAESDKADQEYITCELRYIDSVAAPR